MFAAGAGGAGEVSSADKLPLVKRPRTVGGFGSGLGKRRVGGRSAEDDAADLGEAGRSVNQVILAHIHNCTSVHLHIPIRPWKL